jgi:hypothetical protein
MKRIKKSTNSKEEYDHQLDPVEEALVYLGLPITRENWLDLAWPQGPPDPWTQEHEMELPRQLRRHLKPGQGAY